MKNEYLDWTARGPGAPTLELTNVDRWVGGEAHVGGDTLAVEEPLEIRLAGCNVAVTMRIPGDDFDLAAGFLLTEGIIHGLGDIASIAHCEVDDPAAVGNVVNVNPNDPTIVDPDSWQRHFFASSSCGICGKASIDAIRQVTSPIDSAATLCPETLYRFDGELRSQQTGFDKTGGLHAAALFDLDGRLITLREDVGRHNAVDKVIGHALLHDMLPLTHYALMVSSRASYEIMQKALVAGLPILAAVSAPSSLAVALARSSDMTLVGFLRPGRCNVYAGAERIA